VYGRKCYADVLGDFVVVPAVGGQPQHFMFAGGEAERRIAAVVRVHVHDEVLCVFFVEPLEDRQERRIVESEAMCAAVFEHRQNFHQVRLCVIRPAG
jgi:hypothetical protein